MPEVPHHDPNEFAAHDANGDVKMHTDIDDHLNRLFAADKAEIPWWTSLYENIHDLIKPEKLPPLEVTSRPVAVKSIWGLYDKDPKSRYISVGIHILAFTLLMIGFTSKTVQKKIADNLNLIDPNIKPYIPPKKTGGGRRRRRRSARAFAGDERAGSQAFDEAVHASDDREGAAEAGDDADDYRASRRCSSAEQLAELGRPAGEAFQHVERAGFRRRHGQWQRRRSGLG